MNDDAWTVILTMIRGWGLGIRGAHARPWEATPGLQGVTRRLLVMGPSADAGPACGPRHYVDRPPTARQAAGGAGRRRGPRNDRAPGGVDRQRSGLPRGETNRPRKTLRIGSLIQRFVALRNRRTGPRLAGPQDRLPQRTAPPSRHLAQHSVGRGFADSCQDGEAANVEPP